MLLIVIYLKLKNKGVTLVQNESLDFRLNSSGNLFTAVETSGTK